MHIIRYGQTRFWAVYDERGELVVVAVYKKGAIEVLRRLTEPAPSGESEDEP